MKLLMHICCANCSLFPLQSLGSSAHDITGIWFNPNIHPEAEYTRRLEAVRELEHDNAIAMIYIEGYGLDAFEAEIDRRGLDRTAPARCAACYSLRMNETARQCALGGFDAFTTSLLVSPFQSHDLLIEEANAAARLHDVDFFYEDFRPGWQEGQGISRERGYFRQYYCGCHYSKTQRDEDKATRKKAKAAVKKS